MAWLTLSRRSDHAQMWICRPAHCLRPDPSDSVRLRLPKRRFWSVTRAPSGSGAHGAPADHSRHTVDAFPGSLDSR